jgi:hypothetical protein
VLFGTVGKKNIWAQASSWWNRLGRVKHPLGGMRKTLGENCFYRSCRTNKVGMSTWTCLGFKVQRGELENASCKHSLKILIACSTQEGLKSINCKSINQKCILLSCDSHNFLIALGNVLCFLQLEPAHHVSNCWHTCKYQSLNNYTFTTLTSILLTLMCVHKSVFVCLNNYTFSTLTINTVYAHVCSQECLCMSQQLYIQHTLKSDAEVPTKNPRMHLGVTTAKTF